VRAFPPFREQGPDLLPLGVGQQETMSRHRPSLGAAHYAYRAFWENQLLQNQNSVPSFETASSVDEYVSPLAPLLRACDPLVLQDSDHDAAVLSLALGRLVRAYLPALAHSAWSEHIG
jgi:hypothetical protein